MINSAQVKRTLRAKFDLPTLCVTTTPTIRSWITARIPRDSVPSLIPPFPVEFRQQCIKVVYPNRLELHTQERAGNIEGWSIAMLPHEWEAVLSENKF